MIAQSAIRSIKAFTGTALLALAGFLAGSCAQLPSGAPGSKEPRMFWTLTAPDGGTLYVQGTIHVGGDELYPVDPEVLDALKSADLVLAELSSGEMERSQSLVLERMANGILDKGATLYDYLSPEESAFLEGVMTADLFKRLAPFQPWVAYSALDAIMAGKSGLDPAKGLDMELYSAASELGKPVVGLESAAAQLDVLTGPPLSTQLLVLKDAIREYRAYPDALKALYDAFVRDDRKGMGREVSASLTRTETFSDELADFNHSLLGQRNVAWAERIVAVSKGKKAVFLFAGAAHFVGDGNVLDLLADRGYKTAR